ncbi:MAG: TIM barrel protein [Deltaproteobacteria bacterium]|nr:TIM barrel protein [Deltaproteobacteria bacterium]
MIALSTSLVSRGTREGEAIVHYLERFEIEGIELDYRIDGSTCRQVREALGRSELRVVSVHNYFPVPWIMAGSGGGGDLFSLCSLDDEERRRAVSWTTETIRHTADFGASAVVLHCGYTEMDREWEKILRFYETGVINTDAARGFIQSKIRERDRLNPGHLSKLLLSLEDLVGVADEEGILLGLENRYYYHELPTLENFRTIFEEFEGSPIGYWHDMGHAHANEVLGIMRPGELLEEYGDRLVGVHLHDARGLEDHLAPGTGEIDFSVLDAVPRRGIIHVVELRFGIHEADVKMGIEYVRDRIFRE